MVRWGDRIRLGVAVSAAALMAACAPLHTSAPGELGAVRDTAPSLSAFTFDQAALANAEDFDRWRAFEARNAESQHAFEACLENKDTCAAVDLVRFRRLLELGRDLAPRRQLNLVQAYFNLVTWVAEDRDTWQSLYDVALTHRGDCEDIALAKYATLRRLGWAAADLRVVIGWDSEARDWHAWLLVNDGGDVRVLDSIEAVEKPRRFRASRAVYSISELGIWDHAPDYIPLGAGTVPERAARLAALEKAETKGISP